MNEIVGLIFIVVGVLFNAFGCVGLLRLPDFYTRLQGATKCVTLGTCGIMFGVFIRSGFSPMGIKALVVIVFIFITSPVAAHALAQGAHMFGVTLWRKSVCDKYQDDKGSNRIAD